MTLGTCRARAAGASCRRSFPHGVAVMNARHPFPESSPSGSPRTEPDLSLAHSAQSPPMAGVELPRHLHRPRDFGIGYGNSNGYGSDLHYVDEIGREHVLTPVTNAHLVCQLPLEIKNRTTP